MKRSQFIALLVLLSFFLIYASPTNTPFLNPPGQCSQYNNAADCESHGCEAEYTEKAARNAFGCESTVSAFSKCKERDCTPLPSSTLSNSPTKNVVPVIPYIGGETFPVSIQIRKSGPSYTFNSLSGNRYSTENLASGEYCKVIGVNFLDGTESYSYPLEPAGQQALDETTMLCLYRANTALMIAPLDNRMVYVFDNGVRVSNCPTNTPQEDQTTCKTSWEGMCTIRAAGKVQMPVLIKEYCGGWNARVLSSGQDFQSEVNTCDQEIKNSIPAPEPEEKCGDGKIDQGEECDGPNLNGKTCRTANPRYKGGTLKCDPSCEFDTGECKQDISAMVHFKIKNEVKDQNKNPAVSLTQTPYIYYGDSIITIDAKNADGSGPEELTYKLKIVGTKAFQGIYYGALMKIRKESPEFWATLVEANDKKGVISLGIIREITGIEENIIISDLYWKDTTLNDLLKDEGVSDGETIWTELTLHVKKTGQGSTIEVSQELWYTDQKLIGSDENKRIAQSSATLTRSQQQTNGLYKDLLRALKGYVQKTEGSTETKLDVPAIKSDKEIELIKKGGTSYKKGTSLEQMWTLAAGWLYIRTHITFQRINVQDMVTYFIELFPEELSSGGWDSPESLGSVNSFDFSSTEFA